MTPKGERESAAWTAVGAAAVVGTPVVGATIRTVAAVRASTHTASRMGMGDPAVTGTPAGVVVGDHSIRIDGAAAMAAVADDSSGIRIVSGLGFLRENGEAEKSRQDYQYCCE